MSNEVYKAWFLWYNIHVQKIETLRSNIFGGVFMFYFVDHEKNANYVKEKIKRFVRDL